MDRPYGIIIDTLLVVNKHVMWQAARQARLTCDHPEQREQRHPHVLKICLPVQILPVFDAAPQRHANHRIDEEKQPEHADNVAQSCTQHGGGVEVKMSVASSSEVFLKIVVSGLVTATRLTSRTVYAAINVASRKLVGAAASFEISRRFGRFRDCKAPTWQRHKQSSQQHPQTLRLGYQAENAHHPQHPQQWKKLQVGWRTQVHCYADDGDQYNDDIKPAPGVLQHKNTSTSCGEGECTRFLYARCNIEVK